METRFPNLRTDTRPLYARTVDALTGLLESGALKPGEALPSEEALARQLGVGRSTVREAITQLANDGLVTRKHGIGTFVSEWPRGHFFGGLERLQSYRSLARLAGMPVEVVERRVSVLEAPDELAAILQVPVASEVVRVATVEAINGCRSAYLDGYIPGHLVERAHVGAATGSLLEYLVEQTELALAYTESELFAIEADSDLAAVLQIPLGRSVLHLEETVYTETSEVVAQLRNYFLTDCFNFRIFRRIVKGRSGNAAGLGA